ncbi:MAG TPA: phosphotransferase family protein [Nevskiaceae bacterium]|nr:phosphotransferase family protein [Nevskiaceae bacterium]
MSTPVPDEQREVQQRLEAHARRLGSSATVVVEGRAGEGDSQENWFFRLRTDGGVQHRVLRRNARSVASDSDRGREFEALRRLQGQGLPIPAVEWLDATGESFGRPGFTMERCEGETDLMALTPMNRFGWDEAARVALARRFTALMAQIHAIDWTRCGLGSVLGVPGASIADVRMQAIVDEIERQRLEAYPEIEETLDWLRARPPKPCTPVLTHGDFRVVQALLRRDGSIGALLDWEFVRLSDPLEELAHFLMPPMQPVHSIPGAWEADDFIADYEAASGRRVDRADLHWWRVLNMLWVMGFMLQTLRGMVEQRVNAIRSHAFVSRLLGQLLALTRD